MNQVKHVMNINVRPRFLYAWPTGGGIDVVDIAGKEALGIGADGLLDWSV